MAVMAVCSAMVMMLSMRRKKGLASEKLTHMTTSASGAVSFCQISVLCFFADALKFIGSPPTRFRKCCWPC